MACNLSAGRNEVCKESIGGIQGVYFINYTTGSFTKDANGVVTALPASSSLYYYQLKGNSNYTETVNSSRDNGTTFFSQQLVLNLKKLKLKNNMKFKKTLQYSVQKTFESEDISNKTLKKYFTFNDCDGECFQSDCKNGTIISEVVWELDNHGLTYADAHKANFGYVRRDGAWVPVVIDVGVESFTDWDDSIYGSFNDEENECDCPQCRKAREQYA